MSGIRDDLELAFSGKERLWEEARGGRLFLTGGTGFVGCWLLESLLWADEELGLHARVSVLTRDAGRFRKRAPHLAVDPRVRLIENDVEHFTLPNEGVSHVVHAAGESGSVSPPALAGAALRAKGAMRNVLRQAQKGGIGKMLFVSSGAVYGTLRPDGAAFTEEDSSRPASLRNLNAYGESKQQAEDMGTAFAGEAGFQFKIARGFAFLGPYMPLDGHFAAGNFIADALGRTCILVRGDGTAVRTYLHGADMAAWLWTILFWGEHGRAYNVGSDSPVSILELAAKIGNACRPVREVRLAPGAAQGLGSDYYIPDIGRARRELALNVSISLDQAVERTLSWHQSHADPHLRARAQ